MKTQLLPFLRLGAALLAVSAAAFVAAADGDTTRIKFSDPSKPGTLKFSLPWAEVSITGTDGDEVVVTSSLESKKEKAEVDAEGFRRLDDDVSFELKEKNNVVTLAIAGDQPWHMSQGAEFRVQVPRNTNLIVRTQLGGDIVIRNIDGEIDVNSMNGEVKVTDISNATVINTMNGEVVAAFAKVPAKPISITTMNGEIDLRLPVETKANLRLRTHNGSIRTNFPDGVLIAKTEKAGTWRHGGRTDGSNEDSEYKRRVREETRAAAREVARAVAAAVGARNSEASRPPAPPSPAPTAPGAEDSDEDASAHADAPVAPVPPVPSFGGGKTVSGTLNGGGIDISLSSMNGTITLRQGKN